jgi:crotonobetainyl-CoA:carnitine CoA-transferase CaiB-like acyl-CoA transferase
VASLAAIFSTRDRDDWVRALGPKDVCVEPVLDLDEVASDPVASLALLDQPQGRTTLRTVGPPLRLADTPPSVRCGAPALGAQTSEVLAEAGFRPDEIERLGGGAVA